MSDLATKNFEKSNKKSLDRWAGKIKGPLADIEKVNAQLKKLASKQDLTPDEEKLRQRCTKARKSLQKKVDKAGTELRLELSLVTPPPEAAKSDLQKITKILKDALKKFEKGLPLGGGFRLVPEVEIDFKKQKFKKLGVILKWDF